MDKLKEISKTIEELNGLIKMIKKDDLTGENKTRFTLIEYTVAKLSLNIDENIVPKIYVGDIKFSTHSDSWIEIVRGDKSCRVYGTSLTDCRNKIKQKYPDWTEGYNSEHFNQMSCEK